MPTLDDLRELGYTVEVASGSVDVEETALTEARGLAAPEQVQLDVQEIADKAAADATAVAISRGINAVNISAAVAEAVTRITAAALETITDARSDRVAFHERALTIAKETPTTYVVNGPGIENLYFNLATDGAPTPDSADTVTALLDPDAHAERLFQHRLRNHPKAAEIFGYVQDLRGKGWTVKAEIQEDGTGLQAHITAAGNQETVATTLTQLRTAARDLPDLNA